MSSLPELELRLKEELRLLGYPVASWVIEQATNLYDVVIIGGGMAGLAAAFALSKYGITNIKLFDANPAGKEGPWKNYARMKILRSPKDLVGPAFSIPSLTFQAWYKAQYGVKAWDELYKIPTSLWMNYLIWYREVLNLPVENEIVLDQINPKEGVLELNFIKHDLQYQIKTRKLILATGRSGFGGPKIPSFITSIPKSFYAHTNENIDFHSFKDKQIGIIGTGASAFDAAAVALEHQAAGVDMLSRRPYLPNINKVVTLGYGGFIEGYYELNDNERIKFISEAFKVGIPPPIDALNRVANHSNINTWLGASIDQIDLKDGKIKISTNIKTFLFDYIILATGFNIDGTKQPELKNIIDQILLWKDRDQANLKLNPQFELCPYLGPHFEFLEKTPHKAPFLKDLYCFNYAATLSHGFLSSDIPDISYGANRLAQGIAKSLFLQDNEKYYEKLCDYKNRDFQEKKFSFIH